MVEGKPYRYGLISAGVCVIALGLFIMVRERPHIFITVCVLGVFMVCVGSVWSLCQCYPKVVLAPETEEDSLKDGLCTAEDDRCLEDLSPLSGKILSAIPQLSESPKCHSCPTLQLV